MKILAVAALALASVAGAAERPNAIFVLRNSQVAPAALGELHKKIGAGACDCELAGEDLTAERLRQARFIFLEHPSAPFLERLKTVAQESVRRGLLVATDVPEVVQRGWEIGISVPLLRRLLPYWQNGGAENMLGFFLTAYREAGGPKTLNIPPPVEMTKSGVYHPDAPGTFPNLTEYLAWYRQAKPKQGQLAVVTFFPTYLTKGDVSFVDALLRELEKQQLAAAGVFGWPLNTVEPVLAAPPDDPMRVMLSFTLAITRPEDRLLLERQNVHVISLLTTRDSYAEWAKTDRGVTPDRVSSSLSSPELNGAVEPIMVATTEPGGPGQLARTAPIEERVRMAALRAKRWVTLGDKPNHEKRLAMLYYNNPPGKGNIGASYLNIAPSIRNVLETLSRAGYLLGPRLPTAEQIIAQLERVGRNVEGWAPGELTRMLEQGGMTLLPVERYRQWFDRLPEQFRRSVNERWGPPEAAELMVWKEPGGRRFFVIPGVRLGNVFLGPQLLRASSAEYTNAQHSGTLPPHHGYVAAYLYYRHQFQADAVIHMGRHGTLEWLPGKNAGQAGWDASEAILGDLPNVNYYIMDGDGEALQARRRGAAVDLSHLTPMLAFAGEEDRFRELDRALHRWEEAKDDSPLIAAEYARAALAEIDRLDLGRQLGIDKDEPEDAMGKIHAFLDTVEKTPIPLGLQTLGVAPSEDRQRAGLRTFLETAFQPEDLRQVRKQLTPWATAIFEGRRPEIPAGIASPLTERVGKAFDEAHTWLRRLRESPDRELTMLVRVLRGEHLPSGFVGDPLAVPDALPAGRNLHQGDPALLPNRAAWEVGKRLANQLIERHKQKHGRYPKRLSMVLWQGETGRHQGAMEAQALYLMGVEPEWNARGVPDRLKLIPESALGRPRVNVVFTVSGLYRDGLADKIVLLDRAARLAASSGDNALSRQNRETLAALVAYGVAKEEAGELAGARVFTTAPGAYGFGLEKFVEQSRDKDEPETMAQLYLTKMNHVYTEKTWGRSVPKLLQNQLRGNEAILHSRSSNLYGAVDNDDVYQWMGGLRVASEAAGAKPELLMNNMRRGGREKLEDARGFIATELNARNWNPRWIAEMQKEGYSGAREMMKAVEYLYGWQATAAETISPTVWKKMYDVYVADEYKLGMREFFDRSNAAAKQVIVARLLEVDRQGTYRFEHAERTAMLREFTRLVSSAGPACSANVCGNRKLREWVLERTREAGPREISRADLQRMRQQFRRAADPRPSPPANPVQAAAPAKLDPYRNFSLFKVRWVKIANFTSAARKVVAENPWWFALAGAAILAMAGLVALAKRKPLAWSELGLAVPAAGSPQP
jgi:cobaltochelatase CobN